MIKRLAAAFAIMVIYTHMYWFAESVFYLLEQANLKNTYIASIDTPHSDTKALLLELNDKGFGEVVKFKGSRPIYIKEKPLPKTKKGKQVYRTLGLAYSLPHQCTIYLSPELDIFNRKSTIWHEYLHCFGYGHSNNPHDIMYASDSLILRMSSINNYLKRLKRIYE